jgi:hypothetical protein
MTKKDYIAIANCFHPFTDKADGIKMIGSATAFAAMLILYFEDDNQRFDRTKFLKHAGFTLEECEDISEMIDWKDDDDYSEYYVTPSGIQRDVCCEHDGNGCGH